MKVIHVIAPGGLAGAERVVLGGYVAMARAGVDVRLLIIEEARALAQQGPFFDEAERLGVLFDHVTSDGQLDLALAAQLSAYWSEHRPDVIHAHGYKALFYSSMTRRPECKLVCTHHGSTSHDRSAKVYEQIERALYQNTDKVFAVSRATGEELEDVIGASNVAIVENFLAIASTPTQRTRRSETLRLLYLGRLSPEKGLATLLEAMAWLRDDSLELDIAGDGPERHELANLIESLGLSERVTLLGFQPDVTSLLDDHDALVLPSLREGLPMAAVEALAAGMPILASAVGGLPELIEDGVTGLLSEPGNMLDVARQLAQLVHEFELLSQGAWEGAERIHRRFSASRWAQQTSSAYTSLLAR